MTAALPPSLTQAGVISALRYLARQDAGITSPDEALEWAIRRGFLRRIARGNEQEETWALTDSGAQTVAIVWEHNRQRRAQRKQLELRRQLGHN